MRLQPIDIVGPELAPGEQVRWIGMSSLQVILLRGLPSIMFGIAFASTPFWLDSSWSTNALASFPKVITAVIFVMAGLNFAWQALQDVLANGNTAYAITDRRILVVRRLFRKRVCSFAPSAVNTVEYKVRADGTGAIFFRQDDVHGLDASYIQKSGFRGVPDVPGAVRALEQLCMATAGGARKATF